MFACIKRYGVIYSESADWLTYGPAKRVIARHTLILLLCIRIS